MLFNSRTTMCRSFVTLQFLILGPAAVITTAAYAQSLTPATTSSPAITSATFARYAPFACTKIVPRRSQVLGRDEVLTWRDRWPDTATVKSSVAEKEGSVIIAEVQACLAPFRVSTVRPAQLVGFAISALTLNDTINAKAAFERFLAEGAKQSVERRAWDLRHVAEAYYKQGNAYIPQAVAYLARLDALGPAVAGLRLRAYNKFYFQASGMDSVPLMAQAVEGARRAAHDLQGDAQQEFFDDWDEAVFHAVDLEGRRGNFAAFKKIQDEITPQWDRVRPIYAAARFASRDLNTRVLDVGTIAPVLQSDFVYLPGSTTPSTTPLGLPARGKLSLYFCLPQLINNDVIAQHRMLWQMRKKYPPSVLDIVVVAATTGIDWQQMRMLPKPEDEAAQLREFFFDYMKVPTPLSVRVQKYTISPTDGRRDRVELNDIYIDGGTMLVDKKGLIRAIRPGSKRLDNLIQELM